MKPSERIKELDSGERRTLDGRREAIIKYLDELYAKGLLIPEEPNTTNRVLTPTHKDKCEELENE
jgi:hypothetical protein